MRVVAAAEPARSLRERAKARTGTADLLLFRVGHELFATDLAAIEEAMELPEVHRLPEMPGTLLGMFSLRGHMTPVYSPARALGVPLASAAAASLVVRARDRRIALAVDDVEDVLRLDLATLREPPSLAEDAVLLGVARRGTDLVALVDADALVAACLTDRVTDRDGDPLATRATESV